MILRRFVEFFLVFWELHECGDGDALLAVFVVLVELSLCVPYGVVVELWAFEMLWGLLEVGLVEGDFQLHFFVVLFIHVAYLAGFG